MDTSNKFDYQHIAATKVLENLYSGKYIASILAGFCNSGKTTISFEILNRYLQKYPDAQVITTTHGQNILKSQYLQELKNPKVKLNFTFGTFKEEAQVLVGLPQSLHNLKVSKVDLLIIDEAHDFYTAKTIQDFIVNYKIKHIILLTASVAQFNLHNQTNPSQFGCHCICGSELQELGVFSKVEMDVVVTSSPTISEQIKLSMKKLDELNSDRRKIMFAVKSIKDAKLAQICLNGYGRKVSLSTCENDVNSAEIQKFKDGLTNTLVVVNRGVLGYSDNNVTCLIDLRESKDLENSLQLFARILRKHDEDIIKTYIRLTKKNNDGCVFLHSLLSLFRRDIYTTYNGKNLEIEII